MQAGHKTNNHIGLENSLFENIKVGQQNLKCDFKMAPIVCKELSTEEFLIYRELFTMYVDCHSTICRVINNTTMYILLYLYIYVLYIVRNLSCYSRHTHSYYLYGNTACHVFKRGIHN